MEYYETNGEDASRVLDDYVAEIRKQIENGKIVGFKSDDYAAKGERYFTIKVIYKEDPKNQKA